MTLSYNFRQDDLLRWYRHYHQSSSSGRRQRSRYITTWSVVYLASAVVASLRFQTWPAGVVALAVAAALSFVTARWYDAQIEKELAGYAADPQLTGSFGAHQLILSDAGLREITPATDLLAKWQSVTDVVSEPEHIYVRLASGHAAVISRQSYSGPVAFDDIPRVVHEFRQKHSA
jgi:hypothetical protein